MNTHDFYNLLDGKVRVALLAYSDIHPYPESLINRYNQQAITVDNLARQVIVELNKMTLLEKEQMSFVTKNYGA